ncbi:MAG: hypothetical protein IPO18_20320 [bacterium]|nr:hypothetical protein [bacterium]
MSQATLGGRDAVIHRDNDCQVFIDSTATTLSTADCKSTRSGTVWDLLLARPYRDGGPAIDAWDIAGLQSTWRSTGR